MPKITVNLTDAQLKALLWEFLEVQDMVQQRADLAVKRMAAAARQQLPDDTDFNDEDEVVVEYTKLKSAKERNATPELPALGGK